MLKKRPIWIVLLLGLILSLCFYNARTNPWISISQCLENPEAYHGKVVTRYREPIIGKIFPDGFLLLQKQGPSIRVIADTTSLKNGEFIGMHAIFHKEGYLEAVALHVAKRRREKMWVSVFPVILIGMMFVRYFRFNIKNMEIGFKEYA